MLAARVLLRAPAVRVATPAASLARQAVRHGHSAPVGYGSGPYRGLKIPAVAQWHKNLATFYGTVLWLWLFWRCKNDGPALLVSGGNGGNSPHLPPIAPLPPNLLTSTIPLRVLQGWEHPWDHGHGHGDDHGHGEAHGEEEHH